MTYQEQLFRQRFGWGCEAVSATTLLITSLAATAASTGAALYGQKQQAEAQADYQEDLAKANNEAARIQSEQVRDQQAQQQESTAREIQQASIASREAQATAVVAAGEAGVTGQSFAALLQEYQAQRGRHAEAVLRQKQFNDAAAGQQIDAIRAGASAGNVGMNAPIGRPNYLAAALSAGAQAASTGAIYKQAQDRARG